jgi:DNA polymerase III alpha subunit
MIDHNKETTSYTWFRLEKALKRFFDLELKEIPLWAKKKNYTDLETLKEVYKQRLIYEFGVVGKMGFLGYFLIVADVIEFCRDSNIPTGPGRGSGAGSLMGFLLQITKIDPIRYGLLFERFLNPERYSMPDYDLDISQLLRGKVKGHLEKKYGRDHVASIGTFSRMKVRAAVKDIVRSLNLGGSTSESFRLAEKISKSLDEEDENLTLSSAMKNPEFKQYMDKYPEVYEHVERCENILRQMSMHAAGVLISALPLDQELPLIVDKNGMVVTAYDGKTVEALGYLKLDTLGLKNLDIIDYCKRSILKIRGRVPEMSFDGIDIDIKEDPKDIKKRIEEIQDEKTRLASNAYDYFRTGISTLGIFQCDQPVTQDLLRRGLTNSIEDVAAVIALIRPGPRKAGSTDIFISRKRLEEPIAFFEPHPESFTNEQWDELMKIRFPQKYQEYSSATQEEKNKILIAVIREAIVDGKMKEEQLGKQGTEDIALQFSHPDEDPFLQEAPILCHYAEMLANKESKGFDFSCIAPVCIETQGLPLYQEQIMAISTACAGFTKGESDVLRKAVGKKDAKLIKQTGEKLVAGLIKNGISEFTAWYLWTKYILPYGSYGFNCIDGDQLIRTNKGLAPMKEVALDNKNYQAFTWDGEKEILSRISHGESRGFKEVLEVELDNGSRIRATEDHRFLSDGEWKTLKEIIENDLEIDSV